VDDERHRHRDQPDPDDDLAVGADQEALLVERPEAQAMVGGRCDQQAGRHRGDQQAREVDVLLRAPELGEPLRERQDQKKAEQHLDAG